MSFGVLNVYTSAFIFSVDQIPVGHDPYIVVTFNEVTIFVLYHNIFVIYISVHMNCTQNCVL